VTYCFLIDTLVLIAIGDQSVLVINLTILIGVGFVGDSGLLTIFQMLIL